MRFHVALLVVALGAAACSVAGASDSRATVDVTIHFSHFEPSSLHFAAGQTVTFVVHNTDPIDHEFIVGNEAVQQRHEHGTERHHSAPGQISVPAGTTRTTTYTFTRPGPLIAGCHLPGHYAFGMRIPITVSSG